MPFVTFMNNFLSKTPALIIMKTKSTGLIAKKD